MSASSFAFRSILSLGVFLSWLGNAAPSIGEVVPVPMRALYVPNGFDDNDQIVVVAEGVLPDRCHKIRKARYTIKGSLISVQSMAEIIGTECPPDQTVPFKEIIEIEPLSHGEYVVSSALGDLHQPLIIGRATAVPGPDEHLYMPVHEVSVIPSIAGGYAAILTGETTNTCMTFEKAELPAGQPKNVIVIQPVMKMLDHPQGEGVCEPKTFPFRLVVELGEISAGHHLIHVRSLSGRSENFLFIN